MGVAAQTLPQALPAPAVQTSPALMKAETEEVDPSRRAVEDGRLECQTQFADGEVIDPVAASLQLILVIVPEKHVVHVADVAPDTELLLDETVEVAEIEVRQMLAREGTDRKPRLFLRAVGADDITPELQQPGLAKESLELGEETVSRHRLEIMPHIELQIPFPAVSPLRRLLDSSRETETRTAGVCLTDKPTLENWLANMDDSMMEDTVGEAGSADEPRLRIADREFPEDTKRAVAATQALRDGVEPSGMVSKESSDFGTVALAPQRPEERFLQIAPLVDAIVEMDFTTHRRPV